MTTPTASSYEFGPFRLETVKRLLLRDGEVIPLPPKAFDTLLTLVETRNRVVEKSELMSAIWPDTFVEEANLTQNISLLRKALGERPGEHRYVVTVPGRGYRFVASVCQPGAKGVELILERHAVTQIVAEREEDEVEDLAKSSLKVSPETIRQTETSPRFNWPMLLSSALTLVSLVAVLTYFFVTRGSPSAPKIVEVKSIAVLPFKSLSPEASDDYLALGMADTLITRLSNIKHLIVRPTSAVRRYSDQNQDPLAAGREQQVDAVLDGSIYKSGDRIRVTARLINVQDGSSLWAGSFDQKYEDIFKLQDSVLERLAGALTPELTRTEQQTLTKRHTENIEAYHAYLKGRYFWNQRGADGLRKAVDQFRQAIDRDPNFALAYVGLADCYLLLEGYAGIPASELLPKARAAADRALQLDDSLSEAHTSSAFAYCKLWRWGEAEEEFRRALSLNPNYPTAHQWFAAYLQLRGQFDDALNELKRAQDLEPLSPIFNDQMAWVYLLKNDPNATIQQCQKNLELYPNFPGTHYLLGSAYLKQRRYEEATTEFQKAVEYSARASQWLGPLGYCYAVAGRQAEALGILNELENRYARREAIGQQVARVYAGLGEKDRVFTWLEKDFQQHSGWLPAFQNDYSFDGVRNDPRYVDLLRRMGL